MILPIISVLIFSACSENNRQEYLTFGFWDLYQQPDIEFEDLYEQFRELLLEDFDFLVDKLQSHSPHFGVIYRRRGSGSDLNRIIPRHRESIENNSLFFAGNRPVDVGELPRRTANGFFTRLQSFATAPLGLAHFSTFAQGMIQEFYFTYHLDGYENSFFKDFPTSNTSFRNFYQLDIDDPLFRRLPPVDNNIRTRIITPEKIAYISIGTFGRLDGEVLLDRDILFAFYYEIQAFEHLIIDLRGNSGGALPFFYDLIISPLINSPLENRRYEFVRQSILDYNAKSDYLFLAYSGIHQLDLTASNIEIFPAVDFVQERGMNYFNPEDLEKLDSVLVWTYLTEPAEVDFDFNGKIWILVDNQTASASENAILFAMNTGFATVVGTNTFGLMGGLTAHVILPNTGIFFRFDVGYFTDAYGRSLEEFGITPNYLNRPGMDALQTVLAMIEEMDN